MMTLRWRRVLTAFASSFLVLTIAQGASAQPFSTWATFGITPGGYVRIPDSPSLDPTSAMTVEGWVYIKSLGAGSCVSLPGKNYQNNYWIGICSVGTPAVPQLRSYVRGTASQMTGGRLYVTAAFSCP